MKSKLLIALLALFAGLVHAQEYQITGKISETSGGSLPGATVVEKGTITGVVSDLDGSYTINVSGANATLVFSYIGYLPQEITVEGRTIIDVSLDLDIEALDEVVVIGYGTQKKVNITGSVSVVDMESLPAKSPINVAQQLQGAAPGVQVVNSGAPGSGPVIRIRGLNSFGNNNPLFIVDGNPVSDSRDLSPNDIESIQILKDASAAAIYGSRAANGVILVTTKKGKGDLSVEFNARYGTEQVPKKIEMSNSVEFATIDNMSTDNGRNGIHFASSDQVLADPGSLPDEDWQDALFRTGIIQDYSASISQGDGQNSFRLALGYYGREGTISEANFERMNLTLGATRQSKKALVGANIRLAHSNGRDVVGNPFMNVLSPPPNIAAYDSTNWGGFGTGYNQNPTYFANPVGLQEANELNSYTYKAVLNTFVEYELLSFLKYKFNVGLDVAAQRRKDKHYSARISYLDLPEPLSSYSEDNKTWINYTLTHTLTFDKQFDGHEINAVVGAAYEDRQFENAYSFGHEVARTADGSYLWVLDATQSNHQIGGSASQSVLYSEFLRINYGLNDKYLLQLSGRLDHSSKFSKAYRNAFFPAFSAGWRLGNEDLFSNIEILSELKLRVGYGELGGQEVDSYAYLGYINPNVNYVFGPNQELTNGATQIEIENQDIRWQTTAISNIGLDFGLFGNRLLGSAEYYISDTRDAILPVDIPYSSGNFGGNPYQNIGKIRNSGFEFSLNLQNRDREFKYDAVLNVGTLKNEVVDLGDLGQLAGNLTMTRPGYAIGTFYLIETEGMWQLGEEELAAEQAASPGDVHFIDINGRDPDTGELTGVPDGNINDDDRVMMGSPFPKVDLGMNLRFEYKGFDLTLFLFSQLGHDLYNGPKTVIDRTDDRFNRVKGYAPWTPENPSETTPIAIWGSEGSRNFTRSQDRYLESGDYLKIKNLELGYELPVSLLSRIGIRKFRLYFSAQNLVTFTGYTGFDPEVVNGWILERGVDWGAFPNPKTLSIGAQAKF